MTNLIPGPWYVAWRAEPGKVPYVAPDAKANVWTDGPFLSYEAATALAVVLRAHLKATGATAKKAGAT